ncbi:MAG: hypothetical protein ACMUIE_10210, partial [Thermoplasmatota archaeon]
LLAGVGAGLVILVVVVVWILFLNVKKKKEFEERSEHEEEPESEKLEHDPRYDPEYQLKYGSFAELPQSSSPPSLEGDGSDRSPPLLEE